ncbi:PLD nuclease N-terminal domain-containing protein [Streptomyces sp. NPDC052494]|uniref:PLD nuclease N-terminal domain-containing protein n=1 Tax=Streptomyces sp. NPDC052494 TaxID=3365692 RepID=UPI0037D04174
MLRALLYILPLALTIYAFIDCLNTPEEETKHLPKVVWVIIILLFWIVGPIVWFFAGKVRRPAGARGRAGGWVAPDDNPEFLKSLRQDGPEKQSGTEKQDGPDDDSVLRDWEADLRRREEELKKRERGEDTDG